MSENVGALGTRLAGCNPKHNQHRREMSLHAQRCVSGSSKLIANSSRRLLSTASQPSDAYTRNVETATASTSGTPKLLTRAQSECIDRAIRVDQAGEVAANYIYQGQMAILGRERRVGPIIQVL